MKKKITWNKKVAKKRGESWKKALAAGKLRAKKNPTALRKARTKKGLEQKVMAKALRLTPSTYGAIEARHRPVLPETVKTISKYLKVPATQLFKKSKAQGKFIAR